jgi:hypothetical protein
MIANKENKAIITRRDQSESPGTVKTSDHQA